MQGFRLAIVRQHYRPDGGAERIIQRMLAAFGRTLDVSLITQGWQDGSVNDLNAITVPKHGWSRASRFRHFVSDVQGVLQKQAFDLVQSHERIPGVQLYRAGDGVHAEWLRIRRQYQLGWLGQRWQVLDPFHRAVLQAEQGMFTHPALKAVICNSAMVRGEIIRHYPQVDANKLHIVRNGVDLEAFSPPDRNSREQARQTLGLSGQCRVALFVGSGFDRKGLGNALQALRGLPEWSLLVVGRDKHQMRYEAQCQQWNMAGRVHFCGVVDDVRPFYRAADVMLHPAWYDPAPNAVLEAMAMGLPVLTSTSCGNQELVGVGENGFVVPAHDWQQLQQHLQQTNAKARTHMGEAARQTAENYPVSRMTDELFNLYRKLLVF
jgi:UDP-glucose:(heptosyl)LPS alpha-1,3-glucosyltransferase